MKRARAAGVALALILALLAGCGNGPQPETPSPSASPSPSPTPKPTVAEFALPYDPQGTWDPYEGSGNANMTLAGLVYEGLYELDRDFAPSPVLAQSAQEGEDGLTWTVKLRGGVTFSDGTALTAQAAAQAVNRARGRDSAYAQRLREVTGVRWEGEDTLVFTLASPNRDFVRLLDFPIALVSGEDVWGTGPYVVSDGALTARSGWWRGKPLPTQRIALRGISGADELIAAFDGGDVAMAWADLTGPDALGYAGAYQSWDYPTSTMLYLGCRLTGGPCQDGAFRAALSRAYDRGALVSEILGGHAAVCAYPAAPGSARYDARTAQTLSYDPQAAGEMLDELGYVLGEDGARRKGRSPVSLTLLVNSDNSFKVRCAHSLREDLEDLGIAVTVKALGWEDYLKALETGAFDLYLGECRLTADMDLTPFFTAGSGLSWGGDWSFELREAVRAGRSTGSWAEFSRLWAQEAPLGVLCFKTGTVLTAWGRCEGLSPTQGNLFHAIENWSVR